MAYTPTVWATGDVITAAKLNKAEEGIAAANDISGGLSVSISSADDYLTFDKTAADVLAAVQAGKSVSIIWDDMDANGEIFIYTLLYVSFDDRTGYHFFTSYNGSTTLSPIGVDFTAASGVAYPSYHNV